MIDIHSHFLPGMDDGSESPEETRQMLQLSRQQGVDMLIATPHFYALQDTPEQFLKRRQASWEKVKHDPKTMPKIRLGAEVTYFTGISRSEELEKLCIADTRVLLIEMPRRSWSKHEVEEICALSRQGFQPVMAHIDRYIKKGQILTYGQQMLDEGVLFQSNADFFLEGGFARLRAIRMLKAGQIHFLGSDSHNMGSRISRMDEVEKRIRKKLGLEALERLDRIAEDIFG